MFLSLLTEILWEDNNGDQPPVAFVRETHIKD